MEHPPAANGSLRDEALLQESVGQNGGHGDRSPLSEGGRAGQLETSSGHEENEPRRPNNLPVRDSDYPKRVSLVYRALLALITSL